MSGRADCSKVRTGLGWGEEGVCRIIFFNGSSFKLLKRAGQGRRRAKFSSRRKDRLAAGGKGRGLELFEEVLVLIRKVFELKTGAQLQTTGGGGKRVLKIARDDARIWRDVGGGQALIEDSASVKELEEGVLEDHQSVFVSQSTGADRQ
jgi:hypothetical protein